jgi:O-acetyl-ADP-ribose deacetylase (regulator of RNase III)
MYGSDVGLLFVRAKIAVREVKKFLEGRNSLEQVIFVCFGESNYNCYLRVMQQSNQR